jgi:N2-citryl-N6-acetyl-N6-hydroxylysine synthase
MTFDKLATHHSATAFLNAFFLEWKKVKSDGRQFILPLENDEQVIIPLKKYSQLGRHHYQGIFYLKSLNDDEIELSFKELICKISNFLAKEFNTDLAQKENFLKRIENSLKNIELSIPRWQKSREINFCSMEQALFVGHAFHPTPKSKLEFNDEDLRNFSPEMGGNFSLKWVLLSREILYQKSSSYFEQTNWLKDVFLTDLLPDKEVVTKLDLGFVPFPIHPWQDQFLLKHTVIQDYYKTGKIIEVKREGKKWYPTSSLRTLFAPHSEFMLKFSMNVKLTNSLRQLLVHELDRGLQVHEVFNHSLGKLFSANHPEFEVIHEPVYVGIRDIEGKPIQETLLLGRYNPFQKNEESVVLATLTQDDLHFEENLIQKYIHQLGQLENCSYREATLIWFKDFLRVAIRPLLKAQSDFGILLGSHQQNMILEMKDSRPSKSYFRDCNGTGYSQLGHSLFGKEIKLLEVENGNILEDEIASYLFGYYVIINSTFNVITSIAQVEQIDETELIQTFKSFLLELKGENPKDTYFFDYLLNSKTLKHKGNFLCSFKGINENTEKNPLAIYTEISNPLWERTSYDYKSE